MLQAEKPIEIGQEIMDYLQEFSPAMLKVYLTLLFFAPQETREFVTTITQLANLCGLSIISVRKALGKLKDKNFIENETLLPTERKIRIKLLKNFFTDKQTLATRNEIKPGFLPEKELPENLPALKEKSVNAYVNNADINIYANNVNANVNGEPENKNSPPRRIGFVPHNREETLALEIAKTFTDMKHLPLYISLCQKYPEHIILNAFGQARETKDKNIKKSRGALFTYLVNKYGKEYFET